MSRRRTTAAAGHRPPKRMIFAADGAGEGERIDVHPNGQIVWVRGTVNEKDYASLDAISFAPA